MAHIRVGVLLQPQFTTYAAYAQAVCQVEALGVDTIWNWDHFFPPHTTRRRGSHFEAWTLLTAMATLTNRAEIGCLVTCNSYRNPALLAAMAKTVDHISGGRLILGIGAGWFEREYREYGYVFGTARERLEALGEALPLIKQRWQVGLPAPVRNPIPILVGGEGEQITLKLVARYADIWNGFSPPERYKHKCEVLDRWCAEVGRDPAEIERSALIETYTEATLDEFLKAGARHIIIEMGDPWDLAAVEKLVRWRDMQHS
jgi:probable F420-dependent oxidoreductase